MSRWFRHYAGMMRDEKLVSAAVKAKQPVERVIWLWGAILESASEINDGGRYEIDCGEAAYFLRCDESDLVGILACLESLGRLSSGVVVRWGDRQYSSDAAAERQRRYRERKAGSSARETDDHRDSDVTPPSRDAVVTPQEAETDTQTEDKSPAPVPVSEARASFDEIWKVFPQNPTSHEPKAETAWNATKAADRPSIMAAALRYRQWFVEDNEGRKRTEDEGLRFVPHLATWLAGDWRKADMLPVKASSQIDPNLTVIDAGSDDAKALRRFRGKPLVIGNSGRITVTKAELEQARTAA